MFNWKGDHSKKKKKKKILKACVGSRTWTSGAVGRCSTYLAISADAEIVFFSEPKQKSSCCDHPVSRRAKGRGILMPPSVAAVSPALITSSVQGASPFQNLLSK